MLRILRGSFAAVFPDDSLRFAVCGPDSRPVDGKNVRQISLQIVYTAFEIFFPNDYIIGPV